MLDALAERGRSESWKNRLVRRNFSVTEFHAYTIIRQMNIIYNFYYYYYYYYYFFKYNGMDRPAKFESHKRVSIYGGVLDHHSHVLISIAPIPSNIMFAWDGSHFLALLLWQNWTPISSWDYITIAWNFFPVPNLGLTHLHISCTLILKGYSHSKYPFQGQKMP